MSITIFPNDRLPEGTTVIAYPPEVVPGSTLITYDGNKITCSCKVRVRPGVVIKNVGLNHDKKQDAR